MWSTESPKAREKLGGREGEREEGEEEGGDERHMDALLKLARGGREGGREGGRDVPNKGPQTSDDGDGRDRLEHGVEDVLLVHHPAVEEGQAGRHEEDEGCAAKHPEGREGGREGGKMRHLLLYSYPPQSIPCHDPNPPSLPPSLPPYHAVSPVSKLALTSKFSEEGPREGGREGGRG
jgi:hypothetical protein